MATIIMTDAQTAQAPSAKSVMQGNLTCSLDLWVIWTSSFRDGKT
jgi:hypothetical protein